MRKANWFFVCPMRFALPLAYAALNWAITCAVVRSEFGVERDLRDAIGGRLYSGTSEIQRLIIARSMGLRP